MSGFLKRNKTDTVNPAGGINPASTPNVGQYGWTSYDAANVNQLIQYVNMARDAAISAKESADFVANKFTEVEAFIKYVEEAYERLKPVLDGLDNIYNDITQKHREVTSMHGEILAWHNQALQAATDAHNSAMEAHGEAVKSEASAELSAAHAVASEASNVGSKNWYDMSKEIYDDLKEGQVYQGTWNPATNAYPHVPATNSVWDVALPAGTASHVFDNKTWRSGDRLLYVVTASDKWQQISTGGGVDSVNGKTGAVTLVASDVGALPITGGTITGQTIVEHGSGFQVRNGNYGIRQVVSGTTLYHQAGKVDSDKEDQKLAITGWFGTPLSFFRVSMAAGKHAYIQQGGTDYRIYHQGYKPTAADIDAVGKTGNQVMTGALAAVKYTASDPYAYVSTLRQYQGMFMGNADNQAGRRTIIGGGGDVPGDSLGTVVIRANGITDNSGEITFHPNGLITAPVEATLSHHLTNRSYVDKVVKVVSDKVDSIGPDAINAMPKSGGTFTGQVELQPAAMSSLIVSDKASIMFRDGAGSWMHQQANGNTIRWSHGGNADYTMMELSASSLNTQSPIFSKTGMIAQSADEASWIGIEAPVGAAPYISSRTPAEAATTIAMRFGQTEVSVESNKRMAASFFRVGNDGGLKFAPTNDLSGLTWGLGMDPNSRSFGLHYYSNGAYSGQSWGVGSNGVTTIYGGLTSAGWSYFNNYISVQGASNNILEYHQQGHSAVMAYKPVNTYDFRIAQSNGSGGESAFYANINGAHAQFAGQVMSLKSSGRSWGDIGNSVFYGNGSNVAPGYLSSLVSQWVTVQGMAAYEHGYGLLSDQSGVIGNFGHAFWCNDGGTYHKEWIFRNNGGQQSPSGFRIEGDGRMAGKAYEGYEDHLHWATASLGTVSDARLKTVLGNTTKSAVDIVNQFQFKRFVWNDKAGVIYNERAKKVTEIGLIAQEVEAIDPTLVKTIKVGGDEPHDTKTLDTAGMLALALKAIQEQQVQINELKEKLNEFILK